MCILRILYYLINNACCAIYAIYEKGGVQMNKNKKRRGFTLVELLVVLLILGVLVGLAVPRYMDAQKNARARTFAANVREIVSTLEVYRMDQFTATAAHYPADLSALESYFTQPPINPYTGKSMLSAATEESGIEYSSTDPYQDFTITLLQLDVDDINNNNDTSDYLCNAAPGMFTNTSSTIVCPQQ